MSRIIHQQLWGYNVEEKLLVGVREQKRFNTTAADNGFAYGGEVVSLTLRPPFTTRKIPGIFICHVVNVPVSLIGWAYNVTLVAH
jgi:hypothetical protein